MPLGSPIRARANPMLSSACARSSSMRSSSAISSASRPTSIERWFSPRDHVEPRQAAQHVGLRVRRGRVPQQRRRLLEVPERLRVAAHPQQLADQHHRLRRLLRPALLQERIPGLLEQLGSGALGVDARAAEAERDIHPPWCLRGPQAERLVEEPRRLGERVQPQRPVARVAEGVPGRLDERIVARLTGRRVAQRPQVVVGEHPGPVLAALRGERLQPACRAAVLLGAQCARDLLVGDVSDDGVGEGELRLAEHDRGALPPHQLLSLQLVQQVLDRPALAGADLRQRAQPERPADHGGILDEELLLHGQRVETGGDDRLHRLRHRQLRPGQLGARARRSQQAAVEQHAHVLLREERVPAGAGEQGRAKLRREVGRLQQVGHQPRCLVVGERRKLEGRGAAPAHSPAGPPLDQLGTAGDEHQQTAREAAAEVIRR